MIDLNNPSTFKDLDPKDVYGSTGLFASQCQQMLDQYYDSPFYEGENDSYKSASNVLVCGMGGSCYGAHILNSLYFTSLKKPLTVVSDYKLPEFVNENSVIMPISYSGSTEEVLSCVEEAKAKNAMISGFSSGGKLGEILKASYPGFTFDPKNNPSGQPRLGTGYIVMGTLILMNQLGVISVSKNEFQKAIDEVKSNQEEIISKSQELANSLKGYIPVIFASEHLVGNAHIIRNQLNETSKSFSAFEDIPELNHHLMEGLKNPEDKRLSILFFDSPLYSPIHKRRIELTKDVVSQNNISHHSYSPAGSTKLSQVLNTLSFGGYLTLYLGLLYGQDPSVIPWVDYFKDNLHK